MAILEWPIAIGDENQLRLKLNDMRGISLRPDEDFYGEVLFSGAEYVRQGRSIVFPMTSDMIVIEFRAPLLSGGKARTVGIVRLPLRHMWKRCGQSLYCMWFPLIPSFPHELGGSTQHSQTKANDEFDRGVRNAARDPRWPLVCLSLCLAGPPEATSGHYDCKVMPNMKSLCYDGLVLSHNQHNRLLHTLYRHVRNLGPHAQMENLHTQGEMLTLCARHLSDEVGVHTQRECTFDVGSDIHSLSTTTSMSRAKCQWKDVAHLHAEIESRTLEANLRINKASESIRTLNARLIARQADCERLEQMVTRCTHNADELEIENESMALQLERQAREGITLRQREEEYGQLHRETRVLQQQKETLVLILEDLCGFARGDASIDGCNYDPLAQTDEPNKSWKNLLPPPCDVLENVCIEPAPFIG